MVSKKERLSGLYNGIRCTICGRKLTHKKSVERQIGPECWKKLGYEENHKIPLHKGQVRCQKCGLPKQDIRQHILWRERFSLLCAKFCCGCCPEKLIHCSMLQVREKAQEKVELQPPILEALV